MNIQKSLQSFLIAMLLATGCYTPAAHAVDTDIFVRDPDDSGVPNIIVMFGNDSSSWESAFVGGRSRANLVHEAMHRILVAIGNPLQGGFNLPSELDGADNSDATFLNLGFAMYSDGTSPPGAKVYAHIKNLTEQQRVRLMNKLYYNTSTNSFLTFDDIDTDNSGVIEDDEYIAVDASIAVKKTPGNASPSRALAEILHYFRGDQPMSGTQDSGSSTYRDNEENQLDEESLDFSAFDITGDPPADNITDIRTSENTIYDTLTFNNDFLANNGCADNHIIFFGFTRPQSSVKNNDVKPCFSATGGGAALSQSCTDTKYTAEELLATDDGDAGPGEGWDFRAFNDGSFIQIPDNSDFPSDDYSGDEDFMADEWSQYMFVGIDLDEATFGDQIIRTHWINVTDDPDQNSTTRGDQAFFQSIASNGGGEYEVASTADEIVLVFNRILTSILAENAVFASTALPVSVNVRGTNLNQIYLGVFRADGENRARWWGNLKQYKLGLTDNGAAIELQDADGNTAQGADGFINADARSLWTFTSDQRRDDGTGYWGFDPRGDIADDDLKDEDNPDGEVVEKGAIAQSMREGIDDAAGNGSDDRNIYTYVCTGDSCQTPASVVDLSSAMDTTTKFVTGNAGITTTNTGLDALDKTNWSTTRLATIRSDTAVDDQTLGRTNLIQFYRGDDTDSPYDLSDQIATETYGDEDFDGLKTDARPQVHGDVLHSRPSIINYNRLGDDSDVVVFYGANDGMIHAIQGGEEDHPLDGDPNDTGDNPNEPGTSLLAAGSEIWSFVAEEHFGKLTQQFVNDAVDDGTNPRTTEDREIFFDGTFTSIVRDNFNEVAYIKARDDGDADTDPLTDARALAPAFNFGDNTLIIRDANSPYTGRTADDADEVLLFTSARRGGDVLYAFDVSDPYEPALKWRRRGPDAVDGSVDGVTTSVDPDATPGNGDEYLDADDGYYELGQTWSAPTPITLNIGGTETDVLIFGKGYDPTNDDFEPSDTQIRRPNAPAPGDAVNNGLPKIGAGIMIVNADTGTPIWQAGSWDSYPAAASGVYLTEDEMIWSIPSDVTPIDRERDGIFEKFYVGDTGGNVWRGDISDSNPANWTITKLADLGDHRDNQGNCTVSGLAVTSRSDCTATVCDLSGTEFSEGTAAASDAAADDDSTGCPTFICNDGSISAGDYGSSCGDVTGGTCDGGSLTSTASTCPWTCDESGEIADDLIDDDAVNNPDPSAHADCPGFICSDSGTVIFTNDPADCPGTCPAGQTLSNGECKGGGQPKSAPIAEGSVTREDATQQGFTANEGGGGIFAQESFSREPITIDSSTTVNDRRFLFAPDVVPNSDPDYDAVLIGSGDRELPDSEYVEDRFYMLKDTWLEGSDDEKTVTGSSTSDGVIAPIEQNAAFDDLFPIQGEPRDSATSSGLDAGADLFNATNNTVQTGTDGDGGTKEVAQDALADSRGWFINLIGPNTADDTDDDSQARLGEKVVSSAVTLGGVVFFNTNEPTAGDVGACDTTLGTARSYAINFDDAAVPDAVAGSTGALTDRFQVLAAGGFPPSPVPFVIDFDGEIRSGVQIGPVPIEAETESYNARQRVFWFQDIDLQ